MCNAFEESRREQRMSRKQSGGWFEATMWVMGSELRPPITIAANVLNCKVTSPALIQSSVSS